MRYSLLRRPLFHRTIHPKIYVAAFLIFSVCAGLLTPERGASAQGGCAVGCSATVPATAQAGASVPFMATATASGCASAPAYEWDFGDGTTTSLQQNPTHTYAAPGVYTWKLTTTSGVAATTIATIAGGYGENALARRAPFTTPSAIARDPQGRGVYVVDEAGGSLIRFINTSNAAATIAGHAIAPGTVRIIAGGGANDQGEDTPASQSSFRATSLGVSANGNLLFFNDDGLSRIRVINVSPNAVTIGGKTIGAGNIRTFTQFDASDPLATGYITGFAVHPATGDLYFTDSGASVNKVFKVSADGATLTAIAGNGASTKATDALPPPPLDATAAPLLLPRDIAFDSAGNLYIADTGHARVVKVDAMGKITLALQFPISQSSPNPYPAGLAAIGGDVYVANGNQQTIVRVSGAGVIVAGKANTACDYSSSSCGDGAAGANATFSLAGSTASPPLLGIEPDANGLYILDQGANQRGRVRYLNLSAAPVTLAGTTIAPGNIDTIAGSGLISPFDGGPAVSGALSFPAGAAVDANGNLFISDTLVGRLRFVNRGSNVVTLFPNTPAQQVVEPGAIVTINKDVGAGQDDAVPVNQGGFDTPTGLFVTNQGVFVVDSKKGPPVNLKRTGVIRFINTSPSTVVFYPNSATPISVPPGFIAKIAGGGVSAAGIGNGGFALDAKFFAPADVAVNPTSGDIYVADVGNKAVRKISGANGVVTSLNLPASQYTGLGLDAGGRLYVADFDQNRALREISAGGGAFAPINSTPLNKPRDVAVDAGGAVYVTNSGDDRIARISPSGVVETFAGTTTGFDGDGGAAANAKLSFAFPGININAVGSPSFLPTTVNIIVGGSGEVIFADALNSRVRRIGPGSVTCVKTGTITITGANPSPTIATVAPAFAPLGGREFTLTVNGAGFITGSKVRWNGADRPTNYISSAVLTATIPATDIGQAATVNVTVFNPAPGGGVSNSLTVVVSQPNPQPSLSSLAPNQAAIGTGFALNLFGSQFTGSSVVRWNGSARPTTFVSENQLRADIPASDVQSVGAADVTVFSPEPGGGVSNKLTFSIVASNPVPSITGAAPQAIIVGGPSFTLSVGGKNFAATTKVRWNGQDRPTTFISSDLLQAQISAADIANPSEASVTVFTPTPGGGVSNAAPVFVGKQAATVPATSFSRNEVSSNSIASLFGSDLATGIEVAASTPLPTSLRGTTVTIRDNTGRDTPAPLFFVSPSQINFLVPNFITGGAWVIVKSGNNVAGVSDILNRFVSPGLFSANANGQGVAAAVALCVAANGAQTFLPISRYDQAQQRFVGVPLDLAACSQVYLILYGSGFRPPSGIPDPKVTAKVGGVDVPVLFTGAAPGFVGLDQVNIGPLPSSLAGRGVVDIVVSFELQAGGGPNGPRPVNTVQVMIK